MDSRSWPWKKKASDKALPAADSATNSSGNQTEKDDTKVEKYVQVTVESYAYLTGLEDQVKSLNVKLLSAQSEIIVKDDLVKQHSKVAEEAVSGWEKVEAEAFALKEQLESVTLLKLTAEERLSHLDGALKECMKQIRNMKDESEKKLHDVVFAKTKQWEKVKAEFEEKIINFERQMLKASADNSALSRSLHEHSNAFMKVSEEKTQAEAEIEALKNNIHLCEAEISSMKYELHVVTKELEIRIEEKDMSFRSAEVANKQHREDVRRITKLEVECQRLRGLVQKKLPGPAALAQMKTEVENLGRECGRNTVPKSPAKSYSPHQVSPSDFAHENIQKVYKEKEFLTARLLAMEEEMKVLKETLSNRNCELQASRTMYSKQANKLRNMEAQALHLLLRKSPLKSIFDTALDNGSNSPSLASMSEDHINEESSCEDSFANTLESELSHLRKEEEAENGYKGNSKSLELMDDFLEMEKLAYLSTESNININIMDGLKTDYNQIASSDQCQKEGDVKEQRSPGSELSPNSTTEHVSNEDDIPLLKLKSRITSIFESLARETDMKKLLQSMGQVIQDVNKELPQQCITHYGTVPSDDLTEHKQSHKDVCEITDVGLSLRQLDTPCSQITNVLDMELSNALSYIQEFLLSLFKEHAGIQQTWSTDIIEISKKVDDFSASIDRVMCNKECLRDFILDLTHILHETNNWRLLMGTLSNNGGENNGADCIDKETLLENIVTQNDPTKECMSGSLDPGLGIMITFPVFTLEDFEKLKLEKENAETNLAICKEMLDQTKSSLVGVEQQLDELKSELASSQKSNSLSETKLKCMAESYKILESLKEELEVDISLLRAKAETLDYELQEERRNHQEDIVKYKELQEKIGRNINNLEISFPSDADCTTTQQERELTAAAEKLTECQETILLLGKQLNAIRRPTELMDSSPNIKHKLADCEILKITDQLGRESQINGYISHMSPSDTEQSPFKRSPIYKNHHNLKAFGSSSTSSSPRVLSDKHWHGLRKLFSKGKSKH